MPKLWQVPRNSIVRVAGSEYLFDHIDGSYSMCYDGAGNVVHLAAWTPVEIVVGPKGGGTYSEHITTSTDD